MPHSKLATVANYEETIALEIPYSTTGYFSQLAIDYVEANEKLTPFYQHPVSLEGIKQAIAARQQFNTNRPLLVQALHQQYKGISLQPSQLQNLNALLQHDTFTITTAHQPNIFTGPLYFIYKIMHTIKLADQLKQSLPTFHFVPIYYMGSEDADLDELGFINLNGDKLVWQTNQTGAVGRMKIDKAFIALIDTIKSQIGIYEHGEELAKIFYSCYALGKTIQQATLEFVNQLFAHYGLLVLIPDNAALKNQFNNVIEKELTTQFSNKAVAETIAQLSVHYSPQTAGRPLNLFYLFDDKRERIEISQPSPNAEISYIVKNLHLHWSQSQILAELDAHPERFSANVILRGVFQETILPNIAFIGGGGELAYWLELKEVFKQAQVPYPVLILRNSFLLVKKSLQIKIEQLGFKTTDFFESQELLLNQLVKKNTNHQLTLEKEKQAIAAMYQQIITISGCIDNTLAHHTEALAKKAVQHLIELEKKMLRAEKRNFAQQQSHINLIKQTLFPNNNLQERTENMANYYAKDAHKWLHTIYEHSNGLEQVFKILFY